MGQCKYVPSPGDLSERGCGLHHRNEFAVWLYPRWKSLGDTAFSLSNVTLTPADAENLMEKLVMIQDYEPAIVNAQQKRGK